MGSYGMLQYRYSLAQSDYASRQSGPSGIEREFALDEGCKRQFGNVLAVQEQGFASVEAQAQTLNSKSWVWCCRQLPSQADSPIAQQQESGTNNTAYPFASIKHIHALTYVHMCMFRGCYKFRHAHTYIDKCIYIHIMCLILCLFSNLDKQERQKDRSTDRQI